MHFLGGLVCHVFIHLSKHSFQPAVLTNHLKINELAAVTRVLKLLHLGVWSTADTGGPLGHYQA